MRNRLTAFILIGMVAGVLTGYVANLWVGGDEATAKDVAGYFHLLADIFLLHISGRMWSLPQRKKFSRL